MGFETFSPKIWICLNSSFELCPYGIWNWSYKTNTPSVCSWFELCPYGIWNNMKQVKKIVLLKFELCPYGIWNALGRTALGSVSYLNFVPMGFETKCCSSNIWKGNIWTLSLWDLKLIHTYKVDDNIKFELCPYGIWNCSSKSWAILASLFELCPYGIWNNLSLYIPLWDEDLNFVPMGFETLLSHHQYSAEFQIWTLSLWDLKPIEAIEENLELHLNFVPMGFETKISSRISRCFARFELCPYGIWNVLDTATMAKQGGFELCPYGIWNSSLPKQERCTLIHLNFVPMGFETYFTLGVVAKGFIWTLSLWDLKRIWEEKSMV